MARPQRDETNRSYTRLASYIPFGCHGIDSSGAILLSENRGQHGHSVDALVLLNSSKAHKSRRERRAPTPGFQPMHGDKRSVGFQFTNILIVCNTACMPTDSLRNVGRVRRGESAGRSA
jgi:hypothetical protein